MVLVIVLVLQMLNGKTQSKRTFKKVFKRNGVRVRGLWKRGQTFYAQLTVAASESHKRVRRVSLRANNLTDAIEEMHILRHEKLQSFSPALRGKIGFTQFADRYLTRIKTLKSKRENTIKCEYYLLKFWKNELGDKPLQQILKSCIEHGIKQRVEIGNSPRTINLALTVLSNVLGEAVKDGYIQSNAATLVSKRKLPKPDRNHFLTAQVDTLCAAANEKLRFGTRFSHFIRFLCFTGARISESIKTSWDDIDWDNEQIIIGSDGLTKNGQSRRVDMNPNLSKLVEDMTANKTHDQWLFPSTMRGRENEHARTFKESLRIARIDAGLPKFTFHACRRYFISQAVMSGIDYMTIAKWVGHNDGGILIGKVYGHLSREHMKIQAGKFRVQ